MVYDTVYGCQDRSEDASLGVYSTSLLFGKYVKPICAVFGAAFIALLLASGVANSQGPSFMLAAVGGAAIVMTWSLMVVDIDNVKSCWGKIRFRRPKRTDLLTPCVQKTSNIMLSSWAHSFLQGWSSTMPYITALGDVCDTWSRSITFSIRNVFVLFDQIHSPFFLFN